VNRDLFLLDLEYKPQALEALADSIETSNPWASSGLARGSRILFLGMGSSNYAAQVSAARLRKAGMNAYAELASSDLLPAASPDLIVVPISASGASLETLSSLDPYMGISRIVALTNSVDSALVGKSDAAIDLIAGMERGGIACRTFQHTLALLMALESHLFESDRSLVVDAIRKSSRATSDVLARRGEWLDELHSVLCGDSGGIHVAGPARRLSSAQQAALMFREGPRIGATASETGEWSHVDVYLTKNSDYRMLLFAGSPWEAQLFDWTTQRGCKVISVGADLPGAQAAIRFANDQDEDVRLLTEVIVAELLAWRAWD